MYKAAFYTLGCKVNQYETEAMAGIFEEAGYEVVDFQDCADIYVINTCTVTGLSARKSRQMIRRAKAVNGAAIVAVTGCYPQTSPDEVISMEDVDIMLGTRQRNRILEYIDEFKKTGSKIAAVADVMKDRSFEELEVDTYKEKTRAFLKIQDGCSQFCAYCIIPYARGPIRSRTQESILKEVDRLAKNGFREIVLTGIHLASYGKDLTDTSLLELIEKIHRIDEINRIRLGSIEPSTITPAFAEAAGKLDKLCPHYHISLQSGCDETLKRMNRKYTTAEYAERVRLLRANVKDVSITTDVMVGFPGESNDEFEETMKFLTDISFTQMHVFKFSPRKGTPAASFKEQLDPQTKEERSKRVMELSASNLKRFHEQHLGRIIPVLFEQESANMPGFYEGLTPNYISVLSKWENNLKGCFAAVRLTCIEDEIVIGEIVELLS